MTAPANELLITLIRLHDYCASVAEELAQDYTGEAKDDIRSAHGFVESSALPTELKTHILKTLEAARSEIFGGSRDVPACGRVISQLRRQLAND
ncbi:MAG: hypothetical protein CVV10_07630, partial [Gammaproteobacteria bacterium HGW-Gammaproteobacteria-14]